MGADKLKKGVEHVCDLCVVGKSLSGGGWHHVSAVGVGFDYIGDHSEMLGIRQGRATKFNYLKTHINLNPF
jgi:hypothetical protein